DAPFLTPVPYRGRPNKPAYVGYTAQFLGQLRGWNMEQVTEVTTANARRAFGLAA
ncbi:MAG TPA: TatD family hydrolase, partial [Thermoleophilia bacterium]|nr:TatD family hydrolase [Thermoleophilia bacterium]